MLDSDIQKNPNVILYLKVSCHGLAVCLYGCGPWHVRSALQVSVLPVSFPFVPPASSLVAYPVVRALLWVRGRIRGEKVISLALSSHHLPPQFCVAVLRQR